MVSLSSVLCGCCFGCDRGDHIRLRRMQPGELSAHEGAVDDEIGKLAGDAHLFGLIDEGEAIRNADDAGALVDEQLIEKCRWGALVARDDGAVVAVGFRKLWPAVEYWTETWSIPMLAVIKSSRPSPSRSATASATLLLARW